MEKDLEYSTDNNYAFDTNDYAEPGQVEDTNICQGLEEPPHGERIPQSIVSQLISSLEDIGRSAFVKNQCVQMFSPLLLICFAFIFAILQTKLHSAFSTDLSTIIRSISDGEFSRSDCEHIQTFGHGHLFLELDSTRRRSKVGNNILYSAWTVAGAVISVAYNNVRGVTLPSYCKNFLLLWCAVFC